MCANRKRTRENQMAEGIVSISFSHQNTGILTSESELSSSSESLIFRVWKTYYISSEIYTKVKNTYINYLLASRQSSPVHPTTPTL